MPKPKDVEERYEQIKYIQDKMFENNVFVAVVRLFSSMSQVRTDEQFWHGGRLCARFSAQVWVEVSLR